MRLAYFVVGIVRIYQYAVSPFLRSACRFHPTCSAYAVDALTHHPFGKAVWLIVKRLMRCHPFGQKKEPDIIEYDPV